MNNLASGKQLTKRYFACLGFSCSLVFLLQVPASANGSLSSTIDNVSSQPVIITACTVWQTDDGQDMNTVQHATVTFQNQSSTAVSGLKIKVDSSDAFGAFVGSRNGEDTSGMPANGTKSATWDDLAGFRTTAVAKANCYVTNIIFADQTQWTRPSSH